MRVILICLFLASSSVLAHSGRTNAYGCHNDNINGGYHCHNGGSSSYSSGTSSSNYVSPSYASSSTRKKHSAWELTTGKSQIAHTEEPIWFLKVDGQFYLTMPLDAKRNGGSFSLVIDGRYHTVQAYESAKKGWSFVTVDDLVLHRMKKGYNIKISNFSSEISGSLVGFTKAFNSVIIW
ncbi:TPA: YHYH domain-containing protein [Vibrio vulnificus]|nr:YHYH domain-containing protein [Vibrio vulnificus]